MTDLEDACALLALFDAMPEVALYAKDAKGRFTLANAAELRLMGLQRPEEFLGKRDADFFAPAVAEAYVAEDQTVLQGRSIVNKHWQVPDPDGRMRWYLSSKLPLRGKNGRVVGLCGLLRDLGRADDEATPSFGGMAKAIAHMDANATRPLAISELAAMAGLSTSQFNRRFKKLSGLTPLAYILKVRVAAAQRNLAESTQSVTEIARRCGFHDHSHFIRTFRRETGRTPGRFRRECATRPEFRQS